MKIKSIDDNNDDRFDRFFFDFGIMKRRMSRGGSGLFDVDPYSIFDDMEKEMGGYLVNLKASKQMHQSIW